MPSEQAKPIQLLRRSSSCKERSMLSLPKLGNFGPQDADQSATRLQQVSDQPLHLNQGSLDPVVERILQEALSP